MFYYILCDCNNGWDIAHNSLNHQLGWSTGYHTNYSFIHSFIPLACAESCDSLPFSGASSIPLRYVLFPATLLHQLFFHPLSPHLAIYFLVYLSIFFFPNSYIIPSIFCTYSNQHNLFNLIVSIIVGFVTFVYISLLVNILQFSFSVS